MLLKCLSAVLAVTLLVCVFYQPRWLYHSDGTTEMESSPEGVFKFKNSCTCVPHYLCNSTIITLIDEEGIIDNNRDNGTSTSCENILMDVCCKDNDIIKKIGTLSAENMTEELFKTNDTEISYMTSSCTCVPYRLCNSSSNDNVTDDAGTIRTKDNGASNCKNSSDVCCQYNDIIMEATLFSTKKITEALFKTNNTRSSRNTSSCTCVPYYLCNKNGTDVIGDIETIDVRISENGICKSYEVCCKTIKETIDAVQDVTQPPPPKKASCGKRNPEGIGFNRIIETNELETLYGEFPWMAAILREVEVNGTVLDVCHCGGALIHPQVVMTAAHCVSPELTNLLKIRVGQWKTNHEDELYDNQDRNVSFFIVHPQYNKGRLYNDIALLFLKTPVTIKENVNVVCLPSQNEVTENNSKCFSMGWGRDVLGEKGQNTIVLKKIQLPIVSRSRCQENLRRNTKVGRYFELHESFVCAGGESGRDTCKGDGGGPLVCQIRGHEEKEVYAQVGIVAWGSGCGEPGTPGVYVNVALFRNWIDEQLQLRNLDLDSYQSTPL